MRANRLIFTLTAIALAAAAVGLSLNRKRGPRAAGEQSDPDSEASQKTGQADSGAKAPKGGEADRRGKPSIGGEDDPLSETSDAPYWPDSGRPGIDMDKLRSLAAASYRPIVQYLTAIEMKRGGDPSSLLFIRKRDLEEMAGLLRDSPEELVQKFRQLGVLVSMN
jgi:hypothetical protein